MEMGHRNFIKDFEKGSFWNVHCFCEVCSLFCMRISLPSTMALASFFSGFFSQSPNGVS